jgi:hypothetical protein
MSGLAGTITFGVGAGGYAESNEVTLSSAQTFLEKLRRKDPYYKRNLPHICSFFQKGTCNRGTLCPYRYASASVCLDLSTAAHLDIVTTGMRRHPKASWRIRTSRTDTTATTTPLPAKCCASTLAIPFAAPS